MTTKLKSANQIIDYIIENDSMSLDLYSNILKTRTKPESVKSILYLIKYKYNISPTIDNLLESHDSWHYKMVEMLDLNTYNKMFQFIIDNPSYDNMKIYQIVSDYLECYDLDGEINIDPYIDIFINDLPKYTKLLRSLTMYHPIKVPNDKKEQLESLSIKCL
jgi:hypothetical protein